MSYSIYAMNFSPAGVALTDWIPIHHQNLEPEKRLLINPVLEESVNAHGSLNFSVTAQHPFYDDFIRRLTHISVRRGSREVWRGRVIDTSRTLNFVKAVHCEGELSYLCDTILEPFCFHGKISDFFAYIVNAHNQQKYAPSSEKFAIGQVTVNPESSRVSSSVFDFESSVAISPWNCLQSQLVKKFGGYIRTRKSDLTGEIYIDYIKDFPETSSQSVAYGYNMLTYSDMIDASALITVLLPYGAVKAKAPVLYKQSSNDNKVFNRFTSKDVTSGNYLIVANGGAMSATLSGGALQSFLLAPDYANFGENKITLTNAGLSSATIWSISVYGEFYLIRTGNLKLIGTGGHKEIGLSISRTTDQNQLWSINNGNEGATITSNYNKEKNIEAVLHGDVDDGFALFESTQGESRKPKGTASHNSAAAWDGNRITIAKTSSTGEKYITVDDTPGVGNFGYIYGTKIFDEAQTPFDLKKIATNWAFAQVAEKLTINVNAIDLSLIDADIDSFSVGAYANVVLKQYGFDARLLCTKKTTYISNPDKTMAVFGAGKKTLTDIQGGLVADVR